MTSTPLHVSGCRLLQLHELFHILQFVALSVEPSLARQPKTENKRSSAETGHFSYGYNVSGTEFIVLWDMTPCTSVNRKRSCGKICYTHTISRRWRQQIPPDHSPHEVSCPGRSWAWLSPLWERQSWLCDWYITQCSSANISEFFSECAPYETQLRQWKSWQKFYVFFSGTTGRLRDDILINCVSRHQNAMQLITPQSSQIFCILWAVGIIVK